MDEQSERDEDDLLLLDLLAQELWRAPDHQPRHEYGDDAVYQRVEEADALAAEHALQHHPAKHRDARERCVAVMRRVDCARGERGRDLSERSAAGNAEANVLALHVAAGLAGGRCGLDAG